MSDLIKREDAIKAMEQRYKDILRIFKRKVKDGEKAIVLDMIGCIKSLPSADRPQGEWIVTDEDGWANGTHALICSECGKGYHLNIERVIGDWNYCPNCGARMKGVDDE